MPEERKEGKPIDTGENKVRIAEYDLRLLRSSISRLAQLMAQPESLHQLIRDKYAAGGILPESWQTLLELLPTSGPLLSVSGDQAEWLVDINSAATSPLDGQQPQEAAGDHGPVAEKGPRTVEATAVEETPPEPKTPYDFKLVRDTVRRIEAINDEIREMTEERLNLERIASDLRIIAISPPYEAFRKSAAYVMAVGEAPTQKDSDPAGDLAMIDQYSRNLTRGSGAIQKVFLLAVLLAADDRKGYSPRTLSRALQHLASDCGFAAASTEQVEQLVEGVVAGLREPLSARVSAIQTEFRNLSKQPLRPGTLISILLKGRELSKDLLDISDPSWVLSYYRERAHALILHLRTDHPLSPPSFDGLRLCFADRAPAFYGDPNDFSLSKYLSVFARAFEAEAAEFICALFLKFGFADFVREKIKEEEAANQFDKELWEDLYEQAALHKERTEQVLIVSRAPLAWTLSRKYATLFLNPELAGDFDLPHLTVFLSDQDPTTMGSIQQRIKFKGAAPRPIKFDPTAANLDEAVEQALRARKMLEKTESGPSSESSSLR
jgi:hypothetical protein